MENRSLFEDIQANVLKPHNRNYCLFIFCEWETDTTINSETYRKWLKRVGSHITTHKDQLEDTVAFNVCNQQSFVITIGLTYKAYEIMKLTERVPQDNDFKEGINDGRFIYQTKYTNDASLPAQEFPLPKTDHHAIIYLAHDCKDALHKKGEQIINESGFLNVLKSKKPTSILIEQKRDLLIPGQKKGKVSGPLGMQDDIANLKKPADILVHAFGYDGTKSDQGYGTFMILQKILLHQAQFQKHSEDLAKKLKKAGRHNANVELGKALLIGRFTNGTPLALSSASQGSTMNTKNEFDYNDDPMGNKCPLHAHIRSANPREHDKNPLPIVRRSLVFNEKRNNIIEESMLFISFQSSIEKNLQPIYQRLLKGKNNGIKVRRDAMLYPHNDNPPPFTAKLKFNSQYAIDNNSKTIEYQRPAGDLTTIVSGSFYYCPSKTFLDDPK